MAVSFHIIRIRYRARNYSFIVSIRTRRSRPLLSQIIRYMWNSRLSCAVVKGSSHSTSARIPPSGQLPSAFFGLLLQTLYLFIYFFSKRTPRIVLHRFPEPLCQQVYYIRAVYAMEHSRNPFCQKGPGALPVKGQPLAQLLIGRTPAPAPP